ncbi:hypothetical protein ACFRCI_30915 [Streptomyces sp. NPDC056638]|uniref:hypothetical protein n=1 Tax=Streptomyces sp. NPDC056638 TaxID=3345887 RepID=UPI00367A9689
MAGQDARPERETEKPAVGQLRGAAEIGQGPFDVVWGRAIGPSNGRNQPFVGDVVAQTAPHQPGELIYRLAQRRTKPGQIDASTGQQEVRERTLGPHSHPNSRIPQMGPHPTGGYAQLVSDLIWGETNGVQRRDFPATR